MNNIDSIPLEDRRTVICPKVELCEEDCWHSGPHKECNGPCGCDLKCEYRDAGCVEYNQEKTGMSTLPDFGIEVKFQQMELAL